MNYICVYLSLFVLTSSKMCSTGTRRGPNLPFNNVPRRDVFSGAVPLRGFLRPSLGHEPPQRPRKGHAHLYPSRRISNGDVAEVGQFPWQVALSIDRHTACGASLISEEWVLTAAHCVYNKSNVTLLIGSRNRQKEDEGSLEMTSGEFLVHPMYSQGTNYDLGLIKLPTALALTDNIKPVGLPKISQENETFVDRVATVSGWGRTTRRSELLYHVNVTVVPNKECGVTMPEKICTQGKNQQGICSGDSGGPLVIQDGTQYVQIGVVSFGTRCRTDAPNGYTRVSSFLKWIAQQTNIQLRL